MKRNGFTLVELIIVIAVIGILTAILIPVFTNVVNKANEKSALSDARNIVEEYILEDQIRDNEHRARLPENVLILVYKGNRFYAYGYNTAVGGAIQVSAANPMKADDFQDCIDKYSWNNSDAHRGTPYDPTVDQAVLDSYTIENDGAFYVVPYDGLTPAAPNVRGISVRTAEYPASYDDEVYRLINNDETNEMDFDYGEQTCIFHGCLVGASWEVESTPTTPVEDTFTVTLRKGEISESVSFVDNSEFTDGMTVQGGSNFTIKGLKATTKTFDGWYYSSTDKAGQKLTGLVNITEDTEFTAHWVDMTCTIELVENGGTYTSVPSQFGGGLTWSNAPISTNIHTIISGLSWTAPENNTQQGWQIKLGDAAYATYNSGNTYSLTDGMTVKIKPMFDLNTYTVSFNTDGGTPATIADITVTHGEGFNFPAQPTKTNFNFLGWKRTDVSTDPTCYNGAAYPNEVTSNMAFTAQWGSYTVTFYQSNGDPITTTHNGNVYAVPQVGSGEGYVNVPSGFEFDGWTVAPSGAPACDKNATSYTADRNGITITAKMKKIQWNVTFWNSYDDTEYTSLARTVDDGDSLDTLPAAPAAPATGYTFARWSDQKNGTTPFNDSDAIEADTQIWAVWNAPAAPRNVTVTLHDDWNDNNVASFTISTAANTITDTDLDGNANVPTYWCFYDDSTSVAVVNNAVTFHGSLFKETTAGASNLNPAYTAFTDTGKTMYQCITTETGLYNVGADLTGNYLLLNDITNNSTYIDPICYGASNIFSGIFDGGGHKVGSLGITLQYTSSYGGLFGRNSGTIKNLKVGVHCVMADSYVGSLCGDNSGSILNCHVRQGDNGTDSFVQAANNRSQYGSQIAVCGGLAGKNTGNISLSSVYIGEVLSGADYVGGLVGQCYGGTIDQCWVAAPIKSTDLNAYVNGEYQSYARYCGGLVGRADNTTITNCWTQNTSVTGYQYVGGFIGQTTSTVTVQNCWALCYALLQSGSNDSNTGHFAIGSQSGTVSNCYYLYQSGTNDAYYGDNNGNGNVYYLSVASRSGWSSLTVSELTSGSQLTGLTTPTWSYQSGKTPKLTNNPFSES